MVCGTHITGPFLNDLTKMAAGLTSQNQESMDFKRESITLTGKGSLDLGDVAVT
jgi:hypothetical protein